MCRLSLIEPRHEVLAEIMMQPELNEAANGGGPSRYERVSEGGNLCGNRAIIRAPFPTYISMSSVNCWAFLGPARRCRGEDFGREMCASRSRKYAVLRHNSPPETQAGGAALSHRRL